MKRVNPRTDIASRKPFPKEELLRMVVVSGALTVDKQGNLPGRGYYLRRDMASLEVCLKRHLFERILHRPISEEELLRVKEAL